ncbi:MAG: phage portal protein [Lachnospiraceae bacterium]|nr:phage portal protein [Lachnospiraceae bacterium]
MILKDRDLLNRDGSIPVQLLCRCIVEHEDQSARLDKLNNYVDGKHEILKRKMAGDASNVRIVANHAEYIVTIATGYVHGTAISYSGTGSSLIDDLFTKNEEDAHNAELGTDISTFGRGYELLYINEEEKPYVELAVMNPRTTNVVKDTTVRHDTMFGFNYVPKMSMDNTIIGYDVYQYDDHWTIHYFTKSLYQAQSYELLDMEPHYFDDCPLIEYSNNKKQRGDFEGVITLIDAYNLLQSDRMNDKEALADALLAIENASLGDDIAERSETAEFIKKERILELPEGGKAYWLVKQMNESQIEVLKKALKDDIHEFSKVPCLTDENFVGNSSGVAMKYKLFGLEQLGKIKERFFKKGLKKRLKMICHIFFIMGTYIDFKEINTSMKRSLPVDDEALAKIAQETDGFISWETRIQRYDPELDPDLERERLKKENEDKAKANAQAFGSYDFKTT